jgi:hypothetical protein
MSFNMMPVVLENTQLQEAGKMVFAPVGASSSCIPDGAAGASLVRGQSAQVGERKGIDLQRFFKSFDRVPDPGASYAVQLCTDVPVNQDPTALVGFMGIENAGHTFLVLTKWNGAHLVTQCFGFYAARLPSPWHPTRPVPSMIKDNSHHEINAAITSWLTGAQFSFLKEKALQDARNDYHLVRFNCSDYALGVYNSVQETPIILPPYTVTFPGKLKVSSKAAALGLATIGSTPQSLYTTLFSMKNAGGPVAENILIDLSEDRLAPVSEGECAE